MMETMGSKLFAEGSGMSKHAITRWLERASPAAFSAYAIMAAFCTYFCMYAFRKPFAAGTFEGTAKFLPELDLKILYVSPSSGFIACQNS